MESLQLSQVLADLSNLGAAEPETAAAIVNASMPMRPQIVKADSSTAPSPAASQQSRPQRPSSIQRAWTTESNTPPKFDKLGRRLLISTPGSRPGSAANSIPGTPRRGDSDADDDWERANTLMALYDIRAKIKQQDNSSLMKAREKINALAAKQAAERSMKTSEELRRNRYSYPKSAS
ncbi:hypothetical protein L249_3622 [Ophiocordyceps polyrhachis-furcata BCC 54312]|uniref:Uncharacterized protein n=1 Tax=Ophiocordyceps polyrhachis-furcata BCC 54312 TaxID=1330021 RepID=A0A367LMD9_9HYPO|nr:hypothetical protein L249_3622 [Ophiocordyceps polyrhachis-furcata BCC 54312]